MTDFLLQLNQNASAIQAITAVAIALLTLALVLATKSYVSLTSRLADLGQKQFELAQKQFQSQWHPYLDVRLSKKYPNSGELMVRNLSAGAITVDGLLLRVERDGAFTSYPLGGVVGPDGDRQVFDVTPVLAKVVQESANVFIGIDYKGVVGLGMWGYGQYRVTMKNAWVDEIVEVDRPPSL
jgi:hypothetical protein